MNKQAEKDNETITKAYLDQFRNDNERNRRGLDLDFHNKASDLVENNQDNDLNNIKSTNVNSITINQNPTSDNEDSTKNYIVDELDKNTIANMIRSFYLLDVYNSPGRTKSRRSQL